MVFCEIIGYILVSRALIDMELTLFNSVFDPIKMHVHSACESLFNCVIIVAHDNGIVSLKWCWWLWMSHLYQTCAYNCCFFCVQKH
jgi:hypothetical protein